MAQVNKQYMLPMGTVLGGSEKCPGCHEKCSENAQDAMDKLN